MFRLLIHTVLSIPASNVLPVKRSKRLTQRGKIVRYRQLEFVSLIIRLNSDISFFFKYILLVSYPPRLYRQTLSNKYDTQTWYVDIVRTIIFSHETQTWVCTKYEFIPIRNNVYAQMNALSSRSRHFNSCVKQ